MPRRPIRSETVIFVCFLRKSDFWVQFFSECQKVFVRKEVDHCCFTAVVLIKTELKSAVLLGRRKRRRKEAGF